MTTIATDGRSMAGDGLCTGNGLVHGMAVRKVARLADGRIVGVAGTPYAIPVFLKWIEKGGDKPKLPDCFEALVLHPDGSCLTYNDDCHSFAQEVPAVTGSGGPLALGAMLAGASPARAVEVAAMRDTCTGGTIIALELEAANG